MYIVGINAYHGDAAAALIRDGELVAAVEEERFNRIKHCAGFPARSIEYCLREAGISIEQVEHIGISRNPAARLHKRILAAGQRLMKRGSMLTAPALEVLSTSVAVSQDITVVTESADATNGHGNGQTDHFAGHLTERLRNVARVFDLKREIARALSIDEGAIKARVHHIEHHRAHLASAFYVSPFSRAALLSLDGFGDFVSTMWGIGEGNSIRVLGQVEYPHSLGILYTATTQFLGFPHYGDEGKVMGLAPYGRPRFIDHFRRIVRTDHDGQFQLDLDYFLHATRGVEMSWENGSPHIGWIFSDVFQQTFGAARVPGSDLTDRDRDVAASLQLRLEEVAFHLLNHIYDETRLTNLGLAGGVAYNSVMNGKILRHTPFRRVFVQPAAGDSGTALGVCYQIWNDQSARENGRKESDRPATVIERSGDANNSAFSPFTGPQFSSDEITREFEISNLRFQNYSDPELFESAARDIADGLIVGWFQGRMEFGPRALGNRSIIVDPRRAEMKDVLNERIKKREPFRPFAPSILAEHVGEYFDQTHPSPAMLMVYKVQPNRQEKIPAVTHVDGTGRLQTVTRETNARFYDLIEAFYKITGVPVVLNTSFNENEPIVCRPRDAIDCFLKTRIDVLYLGNCVVRREANN
ncbi:MAG TPA: carbamoyltransferase C-terminal domain-containing protein [Pyrinomonadaceae bacterium]|nr:carbamoyltransferase C-terminal domain-containing protein [Pyrinomonadaceae bacterium]